MEKSQKGEPPHAGISRALNYLRQAENELVAVLRPRECPADSNLLEAHAFIWEAISALSKFASGKPSSF